LSEPVSADPEFPVNQGRYREFHRFRALSACPHLESAPVIRSLRGDSLTERSGNFLGENRETIRLNRDRLSVGRTLLLSVFRRNGIAVATPCRRVAFRRHETGTGPTDPAAMQSTNGPPVSMKATGGELVSVNAWIFVVRLPGERPNQLPYRWRYDPLSAPRNRISSSAGRPPRLAHRKTHP
jgi:hypothetical protein